MSTDTIRVLNQDQTPVEIGTIVYLRRRTRDGAEPVFDIRMRPWRTNMSGQQIEDGWLGTTDDVDAWALGKAEIIAWGETNEVHALTCPVDVALFEGRPRDGVTCTCGAKKEPVTLIVRQVD